MQYAERLHINTVTTKKIVSTDPVRHWSERYTISTKIQMLNHYGNDDDQDEHDDQEDEIHHCNTKYQHNCIVNANKMHYTAAKNDERFQRFPISLLHFNCSRYGDNY